MLLQVSDGRLLPGKLALDRDLFYHLDKQVLGLGRSELFPAYGTRTFVRQPIVARPADERIVAGN